MATEVVTFEDVLERAKKLPLPDRARLIAQLATAMKHELAAPPQPVLRQSLRGLWQGLNITDEDIAEVRRDMWSNFPRILASR
jgi:hypothetical protein